MNKPEAGSASSEQHSRLEHFPINLFAIVMGLGGFAIATHKLEKVMGLTDFMSLIAVGVATLAFVLLFAVYTLKLMRYPQAVVAEWNHPIKLSFFPAVSISLLILSISFMAINKDISFWLWSAGAMLQLITALAVIRFWIRKDHFKEPHLNPAWFIPAVGNVLVPIAGVVHGPMEVSWFFFSFGMLFWVILQTIIFNRLIFHNPLPERLLPTLFILIAPPAVAFLSYTGLEKGGALDPFGQFLYFSGVLFFALLMTKLPQLVKLSFGLPWWAYSFPMAALTLSTFRYYELSGQAYMKTAGLILYGILALLIAVLVINTVRAMIAGKICVPE